MNIYKKGRYSKDNNFNLDYLNNTKKKEDFMYILFDLVVQKYIPRTSSNQII